MRSINEGRCPSCEADLSYEADGRTYHRTVGVEYEPSHPAYYDGVSEWVCPFCGYREGRWSGRRLEGVDFERRWGDA